MPLPKQVARNIYDGNPIAPANRKPENEKKTKKEQPKKREKRAGNTLNFPLKNE